MCDPVVVVQVRANFNFSLFYTFFSFFFFVLNLLVNNTFMVMETRISIKTDKQQGFDFDSGQKTMIQLHKEAK